jgi:hypothetical protein
MRDVRGYRYAYEVTEPAVTESLERRVDADPPAVSKRAARGTAAGEQPAESAHVRSQSKPSDKDDASDQPRAPAPRRGEVAKPSRVAKVSVVGKMGESCSECGVS